VVGRKGWAGVTFETQFAAWLSEAAPSLGIALAFAAVYATYLARVYIDARRRVLRFVRRRRALERVEWWYPEGRLVPRSLIAARDRLAAEQRSLQRAGILRLRGTRRAS